MNNNINYIDNSLNLAAYTKNIIGKYSEDDLFDKNNKKRNYSFQIEFKYDIRAPNLLKNKNKRKNRTISNNNRQLYKDRKIDFGKNCNNNIKKNINNF